MRYNVKVTDVIDPSADAEEWKRADVGYIDVNRWNEYCPAPSTSFRMLRGPEGISVLFNTAERGLRSRVTCENGDVYTDSCVEFFIKPDPHDVNYMNFELNPNGVLHLGIGSGRHDRRLIETDRSRFSIESMAEEGAWRLKLYIPDSFLLEYFSKLAPVFKGNFYKCGDMTDHVHYGAWNEVETDMPDFHVPDFFGIISM